MARNVPNVADELDDEPLVSSLKGVDPTQTTKPNAMPGAKILKDKVRLSVDIEPVPYRELMSFCQDAAFNLGRAKINHVWVIRALVQIMLQDRGLATKVLNKVIEDNPPGKGRR
jgi:hypothetical protein